MINSNSLKTAGWLLRCDIKLFLKDWHNNILDSSFWPLVLILSNGFILPAMGMPADYGAFITISMLIIMASFTAWNSANIIASDFEGAKSIGYELTLPLPYWMVYLKIILSLAFKAAIFNLITLLIGKIILLDAFSFAKFNFGKFIFIYLISSIFFGTFALWAAALAGNVAKFVRLEQRLAGPLFFICGYSFPWKTLNSLAPVMGKLMLVTPWIYAYEGVRSSIFGPELYINYWLCALALIIFTFIFGFAGLRLFQKRLDCV